MPGGNGFPGTAGRGARFYDFLNQVVGQGGPFTVCTICLQNQGWVSVGIDPRHGAICRQ